MVKYKCNDCGKTFKGDYSTKVCPECKSENITEVTTLFANKTNKLLFWAIIVVAMLTGVALFFFLKPTTVEAVLTDDETFVKVAVSGVSVEDLEELYQVQVYTEEGLSKEVLFFDGEHDYVSYNKSYLLPGRLYSFVLEKIGGGTIPNLVYDNKEYRLDAGEENVEGTLDAPIDVGPEIVEINQGKPNLTTRKYDGVTIVVKDEGEYTFTLGDKEQNTNVFNKVAAGDYVVKVTDAQGRTSEKTLTLPDIPVKIEKVTVAQAQSVFDNLRNHSNGMTLGKARTILASSDVKLLRPAGENSTLFEALTDADAFGTEFIVVSFDTDELGKIKSGTLVLRKK